MISPTSNTLFPSHQPILLNRDNAQATGNANNAEHTKLHPKVRENANAQDVHEHKQARHAHNNDQQPGSASAANQTDASTMAYQSLSTSLSTSFNMQLTTQEGDVVTIGFSHNTSQQQSALQMQSATQQLNATQQSASESTDFNISVEGDLNDAEKKSLHDLMQQIQKVGTEFFQGNTKNALQQSQNMGFDTQQIAGFSFSLNMEKSVQAISAYQQVSDQQPVDPQVMKKAGSIFTDALENLGSKQSALQPFKDPQSIFQDLTAGMAEVMGSQNQAMPDINQHLDNLKKMMGLIGSMLFGAENNTDTSAPTTTAASESITAVDSTQPTPV